jgi:hypothetical protein
MAVLLGAPSPAHQQQHTSLEVGKWAPCPRPNATSTHPWFSLRPHPSIALETRATHLFSRVICIRPPPGLQEPW